MFLYIFLSLVCGAIGVASWLVNLSLAERIGALQGSFINHVVGSLGAGLLLLAFPAAMQPFFQLAALPWWTLIGGLLGVTIVMALNSLLPRSALLASSLLLFLGQWVGGLLLDHYSGFPLPAPRILGGLLIAGGLLLNQYLSVRQSN